MNATSVSTPKNTLAFLAGSSFPCLAVPFLVLGIAMLVHPDQKVPQIAGGLASFLLDGCRFVRGTAFDMTLIFGSEFPC